MDTVYGNKNRLIFKKITLLIFVLRTYDSRLVLKYLSTAIITVYYLIVVRQYFGIVIISPEQNYAI